ncbi:MAG: hypothetical protein JWO30_3934 [Fibrobacteres bacterium]|nr:hypothetical protein [Fibrobacterota bacterium]
MSKSADSQSNQSLRIETDPAVLGGKPYIRDTRLSVEFLQGLIATGWSMSRILEVYQYLDADDLKAMGAPPHPTSGHAAAVRGAASQASGLPS